MDLLEFTELTSSEAKARRYLTAICRQDAGLLCPRCREQKLYRIQDGRRRCSRCGYTFHEFSGRFLNGCAFDCRRWLWFLKLFELGIAPKEIAAQMGVSYATALKAQDTVRRAIVAKALDAEALYQAGVWPGPGRPRPARKPVDSPVFGIIDLNGMILCDIIPEYSAETVLHYKQSFRLKTASLGQIVYTGPVYNYLALVGCGPSLWPTRLVRHNDKRVAIDTIPFWMFVKGILTRQRGVAAKTFPLILKELEFRYNYQPADLLSGLVKAACGIIPRHESCL